MGNARFVVHCVPAAKRYELRVCEGKKSSPRPFEGVLRTLCHSFYGPDSFAMAKKTHHNGMLDQQGITPIDQIATDLGFCATRQMALKPASKAPSKPA